MNTYELILLWLRYFNKNRIEYDISLGIFNILTLVLFISIFIFVDICELLKKNIKKLLKIILSFFQ